MQNRQVARDRRHRRVRKKVRGTAARPRLAVFRSNKHIYAQVIDDVSGTTLASASTVEKSFGGATGTHSGEELFGTAPSSKQLTWTHSDFVRIADGRIVERWVSADTLTLFQQAGVLPGGG